MKGIIWFREDLRLHDNTALYHAGQSCTQGLIAIYFITPSVWQAHHMAACRVEFMLRGLQQLSSDLTALNIPLIILPLNNFADAPAEILKISKNNNVQMVFFNRQYEVNELKRDAAVIGHLKIHEITCQAYDDQTILPPGTIKNQQGNYFKVFTAYRRAWYHTFHQQGGVKILPRIKKQIPLDLTSTPVPTSLPEFKSTVNPSWWPAGETVALKRLTKFVEHHLFNYDKQRDFPNIEGTSKLSPYLSCGMISPRQCLNAALLANHHELDTGNSGAVTWITELIWRDFYKNILLITPRISMHKAYKPATENIHWNFNQKQLDDWKQGNTGYPIIDAAMRQLNTTGWMHNRLRMITAMYFTKNLFFDWRLGEQYFISQLIDGDLAANNGGWQWCASTGTDAAPYFRVFNPVTQSERFDPNGDFIRQYCPELSDFTHHDIHDPHLYMPLLAAQCGYPAPTVNLKTSRKYAIEKFKEIEHR